MSDVAAPRWRGQPGRLEAWYATFTDQATKTGCWLHYEVVAPVRGQPYAHGWAAVFPPDGEPVLQRAERRAVQPAAAPGPDEADWLPWDLQITPIDPKPLHTFPRWAWEREMLPAAHVVGLPTALLSGTIDAGRGYRFSDARGGLAHIYGHGNAQRWVWLHADLGGSDVLEVVSAVGRRPGMRRIPPLAFVQLRLGGRDWPRDPLVAAPFFRTQVDGTRWALHGTIGKHRLAVEVELPPQRCVQIGYVDPDDATATCTNSARADAHITYSAPDAAGWQHQCEWHLDATAHAEIGTRP